MLLSVDSDEHEVLTAMLHDDEAEVPVAELRLTPSNGLWLRMQKQVSHELVDADTVATLVALTTGS